MPKEPKPPKPPSGNTPLYSDEYLLNPEGLIKGLPDNFNQAVSKIIKVYTKFSKGTTNHGKEVYYKVTIEYLNLLNAYLKHNKNEQYFDLDIKLNKEKQLLMIQMFFEKVQGYIEKRIEKEYIQESAEKYDRIFNNVFTYEFTDGDLERIQKLINELRDKITPSDLFTAEHKDRILKRLEKLQRELHKKMSNIDSVWAFIGEAGVVAGKFGKDARPLVDLIREVVGIGWRTQLKAEELPSGMKIPMLSNPEDL